MISVGISNNAFIVLRGGIIAQRVEQSPSNQKVSSLIPSPTRLHLEVSLDKSPKPGNTMYCLAAVQQKFPQVDQ